MTAKADIWAHGGCLYYLVTKPNPFRSDNYENKWQVKLNIKSGRIELENEVGLDYGGQPRHAIIQQLLSVCLNPDVVARPDAGMLLDIIDDEIAANADLLRKIQDAKRT